MRGRIALSLALVALLCGFAGCSGCNPHAEDINQASKVTEAWIKLIDQGSYGEAWDQTGAQLKTAFGRDAFIKQTEGFRNAFGPLNSRTLESASYNENASGPGQFVIIRYTSSFKRRPAALEEITVQKEADGVWRPLGYYLR